MYCLQKLKENVRQWTFVVIYFYVVEFFRIENFRPGGINLQVILFVFQLMDWISASCSKWFIIIRWNPTCRFENVHLRSRGLESFLLDVLGCRVLISCWKRNVLLMVSLLISNFGRLLPWMRWWQLPCVISGGVLSLVGSEGVSLLEVSSEEFRRPF